MENKEKETVDLFTVSQFAQLNPAFSIGGLRALIFNAETNGFKKVIRRIGGRVFIKASAFNTWVEEINGMEA